MKVYATTELPRNNLIDIINYRTQVELKKECENLDWTPIKEVVSMSDIKVAEQPATYDDIKFYGSCGESTYVFRDEHFRKNSQAKSAVDKCNASLSPNLTDLINLKGAGNAAKALKKSGHWDEYAGLKYKDYEVEYPVTINAARKVIVKARTKDEAEEKAFKSIDIMRDIAWCEEEPNYVKELK